MSGSVLRIGISVGLFMVAFLLVTWVAALPWTAPDRPGIAFLLCIVAGFALTGRAAWRRRSRAFWLVPLAALLLIPAVGLSRSFRRIDMLAIVFHRDFGMQGATLDGLGTPILQGVLCGVAVVLIAIGLSSFGRWRTSHFAGFAALILVMNPFLQYFALDMLRPAVPSDLPQQLVQPQIISPLPGQTDPDILMIYMESLDRQFADPDAWADVYAPLSAFADQGTSFTRVGQIAGTGWSLAGVVATNCGVPIVALGMRYRTAFEDVKAFMPAMTCLGDIVASRGYNSAYVVGGDLGFGGLRTLFTTHNIMDVTGRVELESIYPAEVIEASLIGWVLDDQLVFEHSKLKLAELQAQPQPYALIVETIGPHADNGFLSRECSDDGRAGFSKDMRRVVACTVSETLAFVAHAQAEQARLRPGRPLAIVLMSDHLSAHPRPPPVAPEFDGYNTVIIVGAGAEAGRVVTKPGSMVDVMPTMLDLFGWVDDPVASGLGRSLLGSGKTIVEQHGIDMLDRMIATDVPLANLIWAEESPAH
jgi:phosphoglycerol transferase